MNISMYLQAIIIVTALVGGISVLSYVAKVEKANAEQRRKDNYRPFK